MTGQICCLGMEKEKSEYICAGGFVGGLAITVVRKGADDWTGCLQTV
jgi:hypothetical protein